MDSLVVHSILGSKMNRAEFTLESVRGFLQQCGRRGRMKNPVAPTSLLPPCVAPAADDDDDAPPAEVYMPEDTCQRTHPFGDG